MAFRFRRERQQPTTLADDERELEAIFEHRMQGYRKNAQPAAEVQIHFDGAQAVLIVLLLDKCIQKLRIFLKSKNFNLSIHKAKNELELNNLYADLYARACEYAKHSHPYFLLQIPRFEDLLFKGYPERLERIIDSGFHKTVFQNELLQPGGEDYNDRFTAKKRYGLHVQLG